MPATAGCVARLTAHCDSTSRLQWLHNCKMTTKLQYQEGTSINIHGHRILAGVFIAARNILYSHVYIISCNPALTHYPQCDVESSVSVDSCRPARRAPQSHEMLCRCRPHNSDENVRRDNSWRQRSRRRQARWVRHMWRTSRMTSSDFFPAIRNSSPAQCAAPRWCESVWECRRTCWWRRQWRWARRSRS